MAVWDHSPHELNMVAMDSSSFLPWILNLICISDLKKAAGCPESHGLFDSGFINLDQLAHDQI